MLADLDDYVPETRTRVLVALLLAHAREGRATVRSVAAIADLSPTATYSALRRLRDDGLVAWDEGRSSTLRPLVTVQALAAAVA